MSSMKPTKTKVEANYRPGSSEKHCGICSMYKENSFQEGNCTLVKGMIGPSHVCDYWEPKK